MNTILAKNFIILFLSISAVFTSWAFVPRIYLTDQIGELRIEDQVPKKFGSWAELDVGVKHMVNPNQQEMLDAIYSEILERVYIDDQGNRVMLSIAYGKDQSDQLAFHYPEVCYPAQGFKVLQISKKIHNFGAYNIPGKEMLAKYQNRNEPVTYWTMVGNEPFTSSLEKKIIQIRYGFEGMIPDGMLIRISSIDKDTHRAYEIHQNFAEQMILSIDPGLRSRFVGSS